MKLTGINISYVSNIRIHLKIDIRIRKITKRKIRMRMFEKNICIQNKPKKLKEKIAE